MLIQAAEGQVHLCPSVYLFGKSIFHGMIFDAVAVLWLFLFRNIFKTTFQYVSNNLFYRFRDEDQEPYPVRDVIDRP